MEQRHFGYLNLLVLWDDGPDPAEESQCLHSVSLHFISSQFEEGMTVPSMGPSVVRDISMWKIISQQ